MTGKSHQDINKNIQFFMREKISEQSASDKKTHLFYVALKVMFTQMQATVRMKLFGEKAIAAMIKKLKQLKEGPMPGKRVIKAVDPDTILIEELKKH